MTCNKTKYCPHKCKTVAASPCGKCGCECRCKVKIGDRLPVGGSLTHSITTEDVGRNNNIHEPFHKVISIPYVTPSGINHHISTHKKMVYS